MKSNMVCPVCKKLHGEVDQYCSIKCRFAKLDGTAAMNIEEPSRGDYERILNANAALKLQNENLVNAAKDLIDFFDNETKFSPVNGLLINIKIAEFSQTLRELGIKEEGE